jgi:hypothetical protein
MTEETLFAEALEKSTPAERAAFLDAACSGDAALRQRVEALLHSHAREGFLKTPAIQRAAEVAGGSPIAGATQAEGHGEGAESALDFLVPSEKPDSLGRLGHYEVQEIIGRGGMGVVLRAFDEKLHRVVAIKAMAAQLATNGTARKRFTREAQAQAAVSHDHIVTIHAVEEANGLPYLVMQFVAGMSLQQRLDRDGPLQLHEILRIGMQTAAGLAAAHAQGLVHRDIKPANILLENGVERVKITDFGLARAATEGSLTQSGVVAGTPQYMSPEQAEGKAIDQRTDLFSLGSVLYAMCTGRAPFRASGSMAVLKRVCEETPTPVRETNPEIPGWLAEIIAKLLAKDPAQRYQSAAEVAELLGRHLAHVQHPSVVPLAATAKAANASAPPAGKSRRLAVAAAVLVCLVGGISLTEATGVTMLRSTVSRIFTPDGTLVVEADPAVKVTVEGDDGQTITGTAFEEIPLRPGNYKIRADRDGKPITLDRELVSIAQGGREVVKVKLEAPPAVAKTDKGAFVLLGGKGVAERKLDTLAEAVQAASDGDAIEIRGYGPFVSQPINIGRTALTIRAGQGFRPVIKLRLRTYAPLVLEGLELQAGLEPPPDQRYWIVEALGSSLHVANCRFLADLPGVGYCIVAYSPSCFVRNCEFLCRMGWPLSWSSAKGCFDNCLAVTSTGHGHVLGMTCNLLSKHDTSLPVTRNTLVSTAPALLLWLDLAEPAKLPANKLNVMPIRVEAAGNVFDAPSVLQLTESTRFMENYKPLEPSEAEALLRKLLAWRERSNCYAAGATSFARLQGQRGAPPHGPKSLADWERFWGSVDTDSQEGRVRYKGGNLLTKLLDTPEKLTPDDFRLRPDSAGYRAGKDGKDLGADVDLVGPGAAYERWKKTPEYQQWLKDSGQLRAEAPKAEPGAFVLLAGKGVAERTFDTLAEAAQNASAGDTIEIRGNGPFVTKPIVFYQQALTIRAGASFSPVIKADSEEPGINLLDSHSLLVLEGLHLQWVNAKPGPQPRALVNSSGPTARLYAVNCRFLINRREGVHNMMCICSAYSRLCHLRNCQLLVAGQGTLYPAFFFRGNPNSSLIVDNCLVGRAPVIELDHADPMTVVLNHNLFFAGQFLTLRNMKYPVERKQERPPLEIEMSANIFEGQLHFVQMQESLKNEMEFSGKEGEEALTQLVGWRDHGNLYWSPDGYELLQMWLEKKPTRPQRLRPTAPISTLSAWKDFWGVEKFDSMRGQAKFQGGDLISNAKLTPELLTPDDFRLRPDSAGYKADKAGKDLGADVDLVGPVPAYERWKKAPEYQHWLKETGQVKK